MNSKNLPNLMAAMAVNRNYTHQQPSSKEKLRDWWYSVQDLLAEKDICLHERKRVELEHILTSHSEAIRERVEGMKEQRIKDFYGETDIKEVFFFNQALDDIIALLNDSDL